MGRMACESQHTALSRWKCASSRKRALAFINMKRLPLNKGAVHGYHHDNRSASHAQADEGIAIIPSFGLPACRNRKVVMSRLIDPVVNLEFPEISDREKKLPPGADEFSAFLKSYIARWGWPRRHPL